jgi:hypothetical protein
MLNIIAIVGLFLAATVTLASAQLPSPEDPWLAEPDDYYAQFNNAQIECYQGSMRACDSLWLSQKILLDSFFRKVWQDVWWPRVSQRDR